VHWGDLSALDNNPVTYLSIIKITGLIFGYIVLLFTLTRYFGPDAASISLVFVMAISYQYGKWMGVLAGVISVLLNILVFSLLDLPALSIILYKGLFGSSVVIFSGYIIGRMHEIELDLQHQTRELSIERNKHNNVLNQLNTILEESPLAITIIKNNSIIFVNSSLINLFGFNSKEDLLGQPFQKLKIDLSKFEDSTVIDKNSQNNQIFEKYETIAIRQDQKSLPIEINSTSICTSDGIAKLIFINDMSSIKERDNQLIQKENEVHRLQRMENIAIMVTGMVHDFNNLLQIIDTYSNMIHMTTTDDEVQTYSSNINSTIQRMAKINRTLLTFFRDYMAEVEIEAIDINELLESEEILLQQLVRSNIALSFHLQNHPGMIRIDKNHVIQMVMNLIINAQDAISNQGEIEVSVTSDSLEDQKNLIIQVSDTGNGIDPEKLDKIFLPFYTTKSQGTGLGLSTVYQLVNAYQGSIDVRSQIGKGTTFTIKLPA